MHGNSKYDPKYVQEMLDFFNCETTEQKIVLKKGTPVSVEVGATLPLFERFASKIGVASSTLWDWRQAKDENDEYKYPEFREAYNRCKDLQHAMLVELSLKGMYTNPFAIFTAKNIMGWRDKQDVDVTSKGEKVEGFNFVVPKDSEE